MTFSLIPTAMAAAGTAAPNSMSASMEFISFIILFGVFFYFILYRPQSKRAQEHRALIASLAKDDEVATIGGIVGVINKITDDFIVLTVADGVNIMMQKSSIAASLPKGTMKSL